MISLMLRGIGMLVAGVMLAVLIALAAVSLLPILIVIGIVVFLITAI